MTLKRIFTDAKWGGPIPTLPITCQHSISFHFVAIEATKNPNAPTIKESKRAMNWNWKFSTTIPFQITASKFGVEARFYRDAKSNHTYGRRWEVGRTISLWHKQQLMHPSYYKERPIEKNLIVKVMRSINVPFTKYSLLISIRALKSCQGSSVPYSGCAINNPDPLVTSSPWTRHHSVLQSKRWRSIVQSGRIKGMRRVEIWGCSPSSSCNLGPTWQWEPITARKESLTTNHISNEYKPQANSP